MDPLLPGQPPDNCEWAWYAVDVKKKAKELSVSLKPPDVQNIKKGLYKGLPTFDLEGPDGRPGTYDIKVKVLKDMQTSAEPGWWDEEKTDGKYATSLADEEVVIQQAKEKNPEGKQPWRLIVRMPKGTALSKRLQENSKEWSCDCLVPFSGRAALLAVEGTSIDKEELPFAFTGACGEKDRLMALSQSSFLLRGKDTLTIRNKQELAAIKRNSTTLFACGCLELSLVGCVDEGVCFATAAKCCCCVGTVGLDCGGCCALERADCYSQGQGCCGISGKLFCCYTEIQFPPSSDIGYGCCGWTCCRDQLPNPDAEKGLIPDTDNAIVE